MMYFALAIWPLLREFKTCSTKRLVIEEPRPEEPVAISNFVYEWTHRLITPYLCCDRLENGHNNVIIYTNVFKDVITEAGEFDYY